MNIKDLAGGVKKKVQSKSLDFSLKNIQDELNKKKFRCEIGNIVPYTFEQPQGMEFSEMIKCTNDNQLILKTIKLAYFIQISRQIIEKRRMHLLRYAECARKLQEFSEEEIQQHHKQIMQDIIKSNTLDNMAMLAIWENHYEGTGSEQEKKYEKFKQFEQRAFEQKQNNNNKEDSKINTILEDISKEIDCNIKLYKPNGENYFSIGNEQSLQKLNILIQQDLKETSKTACYILLEKECQIQKQYIVQQSQSLQIPYKSQALQQSGEIATTINQPRVIGDKLMITYSQITQNSSIQDIENASLIYKFKDSGTMFLAKKAQFLKQKIKESVVPVTIQESKDEQEESNQTISDGCEELSHMNAMKTISDGFDNMTDIMQVQESLLSNGVNGILKQMKDMKEELQQRDKKLEEMKKQVNERDQHLENIRSEVSKQDDSDLGNNLSTIFQNYDIKTVNEERSANDINLYERRKPKRLSDLNSQNFPIKNDQEVIKQQNQEEEKTQEINPQTNQTQQYQYKNQAPNYQDLIRVGKAQLGKNANKFKNNIKKGVESGGKTLQNYFNFNKNQQQN